jgi:hypothetical protein
MESQVFKSFLGESMKKGASHAKVKVLSKDCIFHMVVFLLVFIAFFTQFFKLIIKFEAKYDI